MKKLIIILALVLVPGMAIAGAEKSLDFKGTAPDSAISVSVFEDEQTVNTFRKYFVQGTYTNTSNGVVAQIGHVSFQPGDTATDVNNRLEAGRFVVTLSWETGCKGVVTAILTIPNAITINNNLVDLGNTFIFDYYDGADCNSLLPHIVTETFIFD